MILIRIVAVVEHSIHDIDPHGSGGPRDGPVRGLVTLAVHVLGLLGDDLHDLLAGDLAHFLFVGFLRPARNPAAFFNRTAAGGDLVMKVNDLSA